MNRSTRHNSGNPARRRSRGQTPRLPGGRKPAAAQGEFALPVNATPALPPAASFADLDMPPVLLTTLQHQG